MKLVGIFLSAILAWAVRIFCGWFAATFGGEIAQSVQVQVVDAVTVGVMAGLIVIVETFERVVWPPVKARLVAWWDKKFPPVAKP